MGYVNDKILQKDEEIVMVVSLHPLKLILVWIWGILGFWLLLIPLIKAISFTIRYITTEYIITNNRIIEKYGLISVNCDEMRLEKIENITTNSSFLGRIFGFGDVCIQGANRNNIYYYNIKDPEAVRRVINIIIDN